MLLHKCSWIRNVHPRCVRAAACIGVCPKSCRETQPCALCPVAVPAPAFTGQLGEQHCEVLPFFFYFSGIEEHSLVPAEWVEQICKQAGLFLSPGAQQQEAHGLRWVSAKQAATWRINLKRVKVSACLSGFSLKNFIISFSLGALSSTAGLPGPVTSWDLLMKAPFEVC